MATLISGKTRIEVEPVKITLKTYPKLKECADVLRAASRPETQEQVRRNFLLLEKFPQLAELITATGTLNPDTLKAEIERTGDNEKAVELIRSQLQGIAAMNAEVATALFFPPLELQPDAATLTICIDTIKKTYNAVGLSKEHVKHLESEVTSDFWQDVESEGVIDYCLNFCAGIK